jgi:hypothetical protein
MVYLTVTLLLYNEIEFINIMRIKVDDVYIFWVFINCLNIVYFVVEYKEGEFRRRDIIVVCKLVNDKLKEYLVLAKIIIYNSNIVTT